MGKNPQFLIAETDSSEMRVHFSGLRIALLVYGGGTANARPSSLPIERVNSAAFQKSSGLTRKELAPIW
jgi:hypothetical protein